MSRVIRFLQKEDVLRVSEIEQKTFSMPWSYDSLYREADNEMSVFCVAEEDGKIVGYGGMLLIAGEGDITNIAVEESFRGRGIGREILEFLISKGQQAGLDSFTLEVRVSNQTAIHLYQSMGFQSEGIRKGFYEKPKEDACIMWKRLQENC